MPAIGRGIGVSYKNRTGSGGGASGAITFGTFSDSREDWDSGTTGPDVWDGVLRRYRFGAGVTNTQASVYLPWIRPDLEMIVNCGASPDGLVGFHKILELKAPNTSTALEYILSRQIPHRYQCQIQLQLACTERAYADFVSYDNRLPEHLQLLIIPVLRDNAMIAMMEDEIRKF